MRETAELCRFVSLLVAFMMEMCSDQILVGYVHYVCSSGEGHCRGGDFVQCKNSNKESSAALIQLMQASN